MDFFKKENRILLKELVKTDFKLRYQGSVIGYLWSILKPVMLFAIMYVVFIHFLRFGQDVPHFAVALLLGMVTWSFFSEATNMGMMSIVSRGDLLRKLNFSKSIIVLSSVVGALINYGINLLVVMLFALINGVEFTWPAMLSIFLVVEVALLAMGIALFLSALFVKFRDIGPVWEVLMQAGMYATPIIYPLSQISNTSMLAAKIVMLNPMAQIIQDLRYLLINPANTTVWQIVRLPYSLIPYLLPVAIFAFGFWYFNKHAKTFAEIL
ncbi:MULTISPECIES: ABC transporter permease [unclassified Streptococcus]|uniref:ABC transporter permease n=1 Tax=unclassified Streptococcus TaxID=2608887 RepID=UPI0011B4C48E|nr:MULTISPECIES: ABC transporter permease [unclassified Streptococcus]TWS95479.1 ABC transporter permease [Streptococcus sp. sy018]TWT16603.1 ABC transporter permease [Streptococcus sp. sy010]